MPNLTNPSAVDISVLEFVSLLRATKTYINRQNQFSPVHLIEWEIPCCRLDTKTIRNNVLGSRTSLFLGFHLHMVETLKSIFISRPPSESDS